MTARFLSALRFNSKFPPLGKPGVKAVREAGGKGGGSKRPAGRWAGSSRSRWGMPAIPQSVPTQPASSTHQEREIESIPIRPCDHSPGTGGLEAEPPEGSLGAVGWPCGNVLHQRTGKLQFPVSGARVPGSFSPGKRRQQAVPVFCGRQIECRLGMHSSQSRDGQAWGSCGGQRIRCRDGARPPLPLAHLPGRWWAAG